ncbi:MAG: hypothetical protein V1750_00015, partial [Acidobacteriota bacterium]
NGGVVGEVTELPSLGGGVALAGTGGEVLVTDRAAAIPPYFAGHWVEITGSDGTPKGVWRVVEVDDRTLWLASEVGETISFTPGDHWQGVYRFDTVTLESGGRLNSADPIRVTNVSLNGGDDADGTAWYSPVTVAGVAEISGKVAAREIQAHDLIVRAGGSLSHPSTASASSPESLVIELAGDLTIEQGGSIDVSGRGYGPDTTYPGATAPGNGTAGSHLGQGGLQGLPAATTFGSVYRPFEAGGGGQLSSVGGAGGGVVRIRTDGSLICDGAIRANGVSNTSSYRRGGAGGSVCVSVASTVAGSGSVAANGAPSGGMSYGSGGGGAIAIEYGSAAGAILGSLQAYGGSHDDEGGAGTVYLKGPQSTWGDLIVDNGGVVGEVTELPSLGSGVALAGSGGEALVTDRAAAIPPYFAGHWVEVTRPDGTLKGTWRAAEVNDRTLWLAGEAGETISLAPGDRWQGVYRFDTSTVRNQARLVSLDPIRLRGLAPIRLAGLLEGSRWRMLWGLSW